jgi:GNAT superfamily N-acetyltransferase
MRRAPRRCCVRRFKNSESDHWNDPAILSGWTANKTTSNVLRWIATNPDGFMVAEEGRVLRGVGAVARDGTILLNYVDPEARFRGVSNAMLIALEAEAFRKGLGRTKLISTGTARRFYEQRGYHPSGVAVSGVGGTRSWPMEKQLRQAGNRTVRVARTADLNGLLDLYRDLNPEDPQIDDGASRKIWPELLDSPGVRVFVAERGEQLVATCTLIVVPNLTRGGRPYALIENVVSRANERREGHGEAVLRRALSTAWSDRCYKVMLLTGREHENLFRLYEKVGFRRGVKTGFVAVVPPES